MIGRDYVPNFDGANPQGVQWDSLGSFKTLGAQEVLEHAGGQKPPVCILSSKAPQPQRSAWNRQRRPQTPPALQETSAKTQKRRRRRHNALRRFLAMPAMIRCNYAPDFNGANPQGVQWDSLESFRAVGVW